MARFLNQGVYENFRGCMVSQQKMIGKNVLHNLEYQYVYTTNLKYVQQLFEALKVLCKLLSVTMHSYQLTLSGFKEHKKNVELSSIAVKCMIGFTCHLFLWKRVFKFNLFEKYSTQYIFILFTNHYISI